MKYILVTGASTVIGYSAVEHLISAGYKVFGSVRKQSDADSLQSTFGENFIPLIFDVRDEDAINKSVEIAPHILSGKKQFEKPNPANIPPIPESAC